MSPAGFGLVPYLSRYAKYGQPVSSPHNDFSAGMFRDPPPWLTPQGGSYDLVDVLCDQPGRLRKRGGTTATATATNRGVYLLSYKSGGIDALTGMAANGLDASSHVTIYTVDRSTGAFTSLSNLTSGIGNAGRPCQHFNHAVFPAYTTVNGSGGTNASIWGGATATGNATVGNTTVTATSNLITYATTGPGVNSIGCYIHLSAVGHAYFGRIVAASGATITVEPTPTISFTGTSSAITKTIGLSAYSNFNIGGRFVTSFQNRLIFADYQIIKVVNAVERHARGIFYSALPTEYASVDATAGDDGDFLVFGSVGTANNFIEIPRLDPITGMAAVGEGQLLLFGISQSHRLTGTLTTQTASSSGITVDLRAIPASVGCVSDKSIQYSPRGLIFASYDSVYVYDGSQMRPIMQGRIQNYYHDLLRISNLTIVGSALLRGNHYYLSLTDGSSPVGLLCNLETLAWTRVTNVVLFDSAPDPDDATKCWGLRWWDTTTTAPSQTGGPIIRLDSIFAPTSANKADADGTNVTFDIKTAPYLEGDLASTKRWLRTSVEYDLRSTSTVTVAADSVIDPADAVYTTVATMTPTKPLAITAATNATPIVITTATHGLQVGDWITVASVGGNTNANGHWRVAAVTGTTITLTGSKGNAAYTSGGVMTPDNTQIIKLTPTIRKGTAIEYHFTGGPCDSFELRGITNSFQPISDTRTA